MLATNTSSLSVEQIGAKLKHPERLVGFHFFNPVAVMPLVEVVKTPHTDDATLSTAMVTAAALGKNAVITTDTPGFVVNRILAKVLGEAMHAVDTGTPFEVVEQATQPFGLPMTPFQLLEFVGLPIGAHVLDTHHAAFPDRFFESDNLRKLAELRSHPRARRQGQGQGLRPEGGRDREWRNDTDDRAMSCAFASRTASPTRSTGCSRSTWSQRRRTSTCASSSAPAIRSVPAESRRTSTVSGASERVFHDTFHHPVIKGIN